MKNPKPFFLNRKTFKAFVLGADPTNFSDHGKPKQLEYVFGILSDEPRYFSRILKNLNQIGLHLEDVYIQNTIPEYLKDETTKNKDWEKHAEQWLPKLKAEFDQVNPGRRKPVLVTAERIMKFLVNDGYTLPTAQSIYSKEANEFFYVPSKDNKLNRPLMAFYRHPSYSLSSKEHYRELLSKKLTV
jgi:hypothetical protein